MMSRNHAKEKNKRKKEKDQETAAAPVKSEKTTSHNSAKEHKIKKKDKHQETSAAPFEQEKTTSHNSAKEHKNKKKDKELETATAPLEPEKTSHNSAKEHKNKKKDKHQETSEAHLEPEKTTSHNSAKEHKNKNKDKHQETSAAPLKPEKTKSHNSAKEHKHEKKHPHIHLQITRRPSGSENSKSKTPAEEINKKENENDGTNGGPKGKSENLETKDKSIKELEVDNDSLEKLFEGISDKSSGKKKKEKKEKIVPKADEKKQEHAKLKSTAKMANQTIYLKPSIPSDPFLIEMGSIEQSSPETKSPMENDIVKEKVAMTTMSDLWFTDLSDQWFTSDEENINQQEPNSPQPNEASEIALANESTDEESTSSNSFQEENFSDFSFGSPTNKTPSNLSLSKTSLSNISPINKSPANRSPGNMTPSNISLGNKSPDYITHINRSPQFSTPRNRLSSNTNPTNRSSRNPSPINRSPRITNPSDGNPSQINRSPRITNPSDGNPSNRNLTRGLPDSGSIEHNAVDDSLIHLSGSPIYRHSIKTYEITNTDPPTGTQLQKDEDESFGVHQEENSEETAKGKTVGESGSVVTWGSSLKPGNEVTPEQRDLIQRLLSDLLEDRRKYGRVSGQTGDMLAKKLLLKEFNGRAPGVVKESLRELVKNYKRQHDANPTDVYLKEILCAIRKLSCEIEGLGQQSSADSEDRSTFRKKLPCSYKPNCGRGNKPRCCANRHLATVTDMDTDQLVEFEVVDPFPSEVTKALLGTFVFFVIIHLSFRWFMGSQISIVNQ